MFNIIFPQNKNQKYYRTHFLYVLNIFTYLGCNITFEPREHFIVTINGKDFFIDFSNSQKPFPSNLPMFRFQCIEETDNIFAFPKVSFYNWLEYYSLEKNIKYNADGHITYRQRPYGNAYERRTKIKDLLKDYDVKTSLLNQQIYWDEVKNTLVSIFVPGYSNNMLDRGQLQYIALGCCTLSPNIPEIFPFNKKLIPNTHYLCCKDDYSDLLEKIEYCKNNKEHCLEIGNNAKQLFKETSTPENIGLWIQEKIK